jgi:hypothetical protein
MVKLLPMMLLLTGGILFPVASAFATDRCCDCAGACDDDHATDHWKKTFHVDSGLKADVACAAFCTKKMKNPSHGLSKAHHSCKAGPCTE